MAEPSARRRRAGAVRRRWERLRSAPASRRSLPAQYRRWRRAVEPRGASLRRLAAEVGAGEEAPSLLLLLPSRPGEEAAVRRTLRSLLRQPYPRWRIATFEPVETSLREAAGDRLRVAREEPTEAWWVPLLRAGRPEPGERVGVLQPGSRVTAHGLVEVARALRRSRCDLLYTDWDELDAAGRRSRPHFAYGWSPELLLGADPLRGLVLQTTELMERTGWWRTEDVPAELHAQRLRASALARTPCHVAAVAVSRPRRGGGDVPVAARRRCVEGWLAGRGEAARVEVGREPEVADVRFAVAGEPAVDIIIPTRDRADLLRRCLESVARSSYRNRRVLVVDNGSREATTAHYLAGLPHPVLPHPGEFNYSAIVNHAARECAAPYLVLLNNDAVVRSPDWLEVMLGWCQRDRTGAVGARLLFGDGRVQHEGVGIGIGRVAANLDLGWSAARACSAVTAACMMVRRDAFEAVRGFDEGLRVAFGDVDFCLRLWGAGWRVVMTPLAELRHDEGSTRGGLAPEPDYAAFCRRWGEEARLRDAFLGPHVSWPRPLALRIPSRPKR